MVPGLTDNSLIVSLFRFSIFSFLLGGPSSLGFPSPRGFLPLLGFAYGRPNSRTVISLICPVGVCNVREAGHVSGNVQIKFVYWLAVEMETPSNSTNSSPKASPALAAGESLLIVEQTTFPFQSEKLQSSVPCSVSFVAIKSGIKFLIWLEEMA